MYQLKKSSVFFSSNTTRAQKEWITHVLGVKEVAKFESCLGLPTLIGRSKYQAFSFLKECPEENSGVERKVAI